MHKYEGSKTTYAVGIVGARGYSGLELARLLLAHPEAELKACFATDPSAFALANELYVADTTGANLAATVPTLGMNALDTADVAKSFHTIFLATPAEVSLELAPKLVAKGVNVVDLSGAFRLSADAYPKWYGFTHTATEALATAQYGLVPFAKPFTKKDGKGVLVSNPGCYVTSVLMALVPLLKAGVLKPESIVIDAKSGTTGAGKKASEGLLFSEVAGECLPYKVASHQHYPEITDYLKAYTGVEAKPFFATSLLATPRGIISGIYANLAAKKSADDVAAAFETAFSGYPLALVAKIGAAGAAKLLSLKNVVGTNRVQIAYAVDGEKLYLYSTLDNLLKGAASQAVENFNRLVDRPAHLGLLN
jgi:N-acetyl-gamma-glutamyl-phosphate reductase